MDKGSKLENYVDVNRKGENGTETDENLKENQKERISNVLAINPEKPRKNKIITETMR